jgi:hypothetical protein
METVVAPGPGQGQAYIWKPDNQLSDQIFRMGQIASMNQARLKATEKAAKEKARKDMEQAAVKTSEMGLYDPVYQPRTKSWIDNYLKEPDELNRMNMRSERGVNDASFQANNLIAKDRISKLQSDQNYNAEALLPNWYRYLPEAEKEVPNGVPTPDIVFEKVLSKPDAYNYGFIGSRLLKNVANQTIETGGRRLSTTMTKPMIVDENNNLNLELAKGAILSDAIASKAFKAEIDNQVDQLLLPLKGAASKAQMEALIAQKTPEIELNAAKKFFPQAYTSVSRTNQFGAVPAGPKPDKAEDIRAEFTKIPLRSLNRDIVERLPDGQVTSKPVSPDNATDYEATGLVLWGGNSAATKELAASSIPRGTEVRPLELLTIEKLPPVAPQNFDKEVKVGDKTFILSRPYKEGEVLDPKDAKTLREKAGYKNIQERTRTKANTLKTADSFIENGGTVAYVAMAFANRDLEYDGKIYKKNDKLPPNVAKQFSKKDYDVELGYLLTPMQQQNVETVSVGPNGETVRTTTGLTNPKTDLLGESFISRDKAFKLNAQTREKARKLGLTEQQLNDKILKENGFGSDLKPASRYGQIRSNRNQPAAPKEKPLDKD